MAKEIICTLEKEGFKAYYYPGSKENNKAVISVGASSCDEKTCIAMADFLRKAGWNVLVLGYYHWQGLSKTLSEIPVDYAEKAVKWLKETQKMEKIAMTGISEGASYALSCGVRIPDITCVISVVPYDYVMEGTTGGTKRLHTSVYTYHGEIVPYTETKLMDKGSLYWMLNAAKAKGYGVSRMLRWGYDQQEKDLNPASRIKVEKMNADVLLLGVKEDDCWPSDVAVPRMEKILKNNNYPHRVESYIYEKASHALMDGLNAMGAIDRFELKQMFSAEKKYPKECEEARQDSFKRILKFLEEWQ